MPQVSRDGGITSPATEGRGGSDAVEGGRTALDNKTSLLNTQPPRAFPGPRVRDYSPYPYSDTISSYDKTALKEAVFDDDMEQLRDGLSLLVPLPPPTPQPGQLRAREGGLGACSAQSSVCLGAGAHRGSMGKAL